MNKYFTALRVVTLVFGLLVSHSTTLGGSATWSATPGNSNWNVATNWTPTTIPNSAVDGANFNASSMHSISLSASTQVNGIYFGLAATSPYTITTSPGLTFTISGLGISNNSPATENFVASVSGAFVGQTEFKNSASAGTLTSFTNNGSMFSSVYFGAETHFFNTSTADHARLNNNGGGVNGAKGGITGFYDGATAASAIINNNGGAVSGASGGLTTFVGNSSAENALITNRRGAVNGAGGGYTLFYDNATAYSAVFTNLDSGSTGGNGGVSFLGNSSAGGGVFANNGGTFNGALGGYTSFSENSTARVGTYYNYGGTVIGGGGGHTGFGNTATAYYGTFANYGGTSIAASGGATIFTANSTAGNGEFSNFAATAFGGEGGWTEFYYNSTAGNGTFTNYPAPFNTTGPGTTTFNDTATAGNGTFVNNGGASGASGRTLFSGSSSAGSGNFTNNAAASSTQTGGYTDFSTSATAGTATFDNKAGAASGVAGGFMSFSNTATAGNATIYNRGAAVASGGGGSTYFAGSSTAGGSTLYAEAGSASGLGGSIVFQDTSDGGTARAVLSGAGISAGGLDLTELNSAGMGIGSIEGAGVVSLGSKMLTVGGNNLDTIYSGIIRNSGSLTKDGTGALTLSGDNIYTGGTTVNSGTLIVNGSIAGNADVKSGATLKGTGTIAGVLTCETGSICAPGTSPGTLTVGGLDLMSGSTLEFELGATRDHIVVTSQGGVSLGGVLNISLLDGFIPIEPFSLFEGSIETMTGTFSAVHAPIFNGHTLRVIYGANQATLQVADAGDLVQVASFSTSIPGGTGNFTSLPAAPGYSSSGEVAFYGAGSGAQQGIYRIVNQGTPVKVADLNTAIPGGAGNFTSFIPQDPVLPQEPTRPNISGSSVAFFGAGSGGQQGIYVSIPVDPTIPVDPVRIADTSTAIPGGTGNFTSFIPQEPFAPSPSISGNNVAFFGAGSGGQQGIYRVIPQDPTVPGNPVKVVDLNTAIPGGIGNFTGLPQDPTISGRNVVFLGNGAGGQQGVYASIPQEPTIPVDPIRIADTSTAIPGGTGNFTSFIPVEPFIPQEPVAPAIDAKRVAFFGAGSGGQQGIYVSIPQDPILPQDPFKIADTFTAIPGGIGNFTGFRAVSVSDIDVAFLGLGANGQQGIYDMIGSLLLKVVDLNDVLAGGPITGLKLSRSSLVGDRLAFQATFADGSQGLYIWSLPSLAGDFNADGIVDAADYVVWRKGLGTTYTQNDYNVWRARFGETAGSGSGTGVSAAVPEPATLVLLIAGLLTFCSHRRTTVS